MCVCACVHAMQVDGQLVDFCLRKAGETGGTDCGGPAADAFCRQQGFATSVGFLIKPNAPVRRGIVR